MIMVGIISWLLAMIGCWKLFDLCELFVGYMKCQFRIYRANRQMSEIKIVKRCRIPGWKRFQLARNQYFRCAICWYLLPETFHVDHVKPLAKYGLDTEINWHILCPNCHDRKTTIHDQLNH